jgi:hypothetical protein
MGVQLITLWRDINVVGEESTLCKKNKNKTQTRQNESCVCVREREIEKGK